MDAGIQLAGCDNARAMKRTLALPLIFLLLVAAAPKKIVPATAPPPPADLDKVSNGAESLGIAGFYAKRLVPPTGTDVVTDTDVD